MTIRNKILCFLLLFISYVNYAQVKKNIDLVKKMDTGIIGEDEDTTNIGDDDDDDDDDNDNDDDNNNENGSSDIVFSMKNTVNSKFVMNNSVVLAPNPTRNTTTINSKIKIYKIEVYNAYGVLQFITKNYNLIDLTNQKNGVYVVKIFAKNAKVITKTIIKH
ncbi:MAG: T9SS type A sorting domain-containing protein [Flavobacteriaceae bacterium]|nr:T9SS type A sorting domain-containing protein [Flavobacteriaceae bacterium]